jgi:hypothetical protein
MYIKYSDGFGLQWKGTLNSVRIKNVYKPLSIPRVDIHS